MHSRRVKNGCAESEVAQCDPAHWGEGGGDFAAASVDVERPREGYSLLQYFGQRVACSEGHPRDAIGALACGAIERECACTTLLTEDPHLYLCPRFFLI